MFVDRVIGVQNSALNKNKGTTMHPLINIAMIIMVGHLLSQNFMRFQPGYEGSPQLGVPSYTQCFVTHSIGTNRLWVGRQSRTTSYSARLSASK